MLLIDNAQFPLKLTIPDNIVIACLPAGNEVIRPTQPSPEGRA